MNPATLSHRRSALLARVQRRFGTTTRVRSFGPVCFGFTTVADPNRVLDETAAEETRRQKQGEPARDQSLHIPYWAELWESASGVGELIARRTDLNWPQLTVMDLGCGQGLTGCVAAALGARVLFADVEAPALLFARLNAMAACQDNLKRVNRIRTRCLNWQSDVLREKFDVIIGADILYERSQWRFLEPFWRQHLRPGGIVFLGEPGRPTGVEFLEWIAPRGWSVQQHLRVIRGRDNPIRIFELSRVGQLTDDSP